MQRKKDKIIVIKSTGEKEFFDVQKLRRSLKRSCAGEAFIDEIIKKVEKKLYNNITTREIYKIAFSLLHKDTSHYAARYKLKDAIYELGPTGFLFEKLVAAVLMQEGFSAKMDVIVKGLCVNHEVDVVAEKDGKQFMVECKFHNDRANVCDVKVSLYIHSRFQDIEKQRKKDPGINNVFEQGWIFTNTRFTTDAIQYGNCSGLRLVGWNYPKDGSLKEKIDESGLHPVTCLTTLTKKEKQQLLINGILLCKEIKEQPERLKLIETGRRRTMKILNEVNKLCMMK